MEGAQAPRGGQDEQGTQAPGVHIHVGDRIGRDSAGGDVSHIGGISGQGVAIGRRARAEHGGRSMHDDDLIFALNELRTTVYTLHGRISALEVQVAHLSTRLSERPITGFNNMQWALIITLATMATVLAGIVLFGGRY